MKTRLNKRYKKILSAVLTAIMLVNAGASAFAQSSSNNYYYNIEIEKYNYLKKLSIDKLRAEFDNISAVPNNEIWAYGKALTIFDRQEQINIAAMAYKKRSEETWIELMRSRNNFGPKNLPRQYPLSAQIEFSFYVAKQANLPDEKIVDIIAKTNTSVIKGNGHRMSNKLDFLFEVYKAQYLSEHMKIALLNHQNYWKNTDYFKGILREDKGYTKEFLEFLGKNAKNRGALFAAVRTNTSVNAETLKNAVGRYIAVKLNALLKDKKEIEKKLKYGSKSGEPNLLNNKKELANCEKIIQSIEEKIKVYKGLDKYVTKHAEVEKLKALSAENRVSEILKSSTSRETAKLYFDEVGIEEFPEMIAKAHKLAELKTNGMLPAKFLAEAFAKSLLGKPADTDAILNKAVEKYPSAQRAAKKEFFIKQLKEGKIPKEVSETLFPKATQEAIQLRLWDKIETDFKGGKGGGVLGIAMLGFIIGMELISGKVSANNAGLDTRLAIGELIGGSPELAGIYCATEPKIMTDIIKGYAGNKEQLEAGLTNYFNNLIDLLKSKDIMNEPVAKDAMAERKRQQEQALKKALNNNKKKSNRDTRGSNGFLGGHLRF